jgi:hypothetical protein
LLLSQAYPALLNIPLPRSKLVSDLSDAMEVVVKELIDSAGAGGASDVNASGVKSGSGSGTSTRAIRQGRGLGQENHGSALGVLRMW